MMAEIVIAVCLGVTGFGLLMATAPRLSPWARTLLSFPIGAAIYMALASLWVVIRGNLDPGRTLAVATVIGVVGLVDAQVRGRRAFWREGILLVAGIAGVTALMRVWHLTQLSPDSLRYLLFAAQITAPDGLALVHSPDLLNRQLGYPALHSLSILTDRQYLASIGPLFGISTLGFLVWTLARAMRRDRRRLLVVMVAAAFMLSTNRFLYAWFYVNTHIAVAAFLLVAVAGTWWALMERVDDWAWPVGISIGAIVLLRPDSPLFAVVVLAVIAATHLGWGFRLPAVAPVILITTLWYGLTLFPHPHYQSYMSYTSPVAGNMVAVAGGVALVLFSWIPRLRSIGRHADVITLGVMFAAFGFLAWRNLELVADTARATVMNIEFGAWLFTWVALTPLAVLAFFRHRIPHGRVWTVSVVGFALLYWILPVLREGAWREGPGDSGNRILIHFVSVVVALVALAVAYGTAGDRMPNPAGASMANTDGKRRTRTQLGAALPLLLITAATINVGLTTAANHVGNPVKIQPRVELTGIVHSDQAYIRRNYGFVFRLYEEMAGSELVLRADNPTSNRALRIFGGVTPVRADIDPSALPEELWPSEDPLGNFRPDYTQEHWYWIIPGEPGERRWLAEVEPGWIVVPESVYPVPEMDS